MKKTLAVALLAAALLVSGVLRLEQAREGIRITPSMLGSMPVTVFRADADAAAPPAPVVLITHGFAGSQQLMQPLALTLAANGFTAVTFDLPGHGGNLAPMVGGMAQPQRSMDTLLAAIDEASRWASGLAAPGAGCAILAHSMSSDLVVQYAQAHPDVWATVALATSAPGLGPSSPADRPRNLLVIEGELETRLHSAAMRALSPAAGSDARTEVTYGQFSDGSARRAVFARGVEHIGVLYSAQAAGEAVAWLKQAAGATATGTPIIASYGRSLGLILLGVLGLGWAFARGLGWALRRGANANLADGVSPGPAVLSAGPPTRAFWRTIWPLFVAPALLTPLVLWPVRTDALPILLGDYLALHFGLYGLITAALLWRRGALRFPSTGMPVVAAATVAWIAFDLLAIGVPVHRYLFNLALIPERWELLPAIAAGTMPWFIADETLTRGPLAPRGAYVASKAAFLVSLVIAIALDPMHLFFLALIVPAILLLFVLFGLLSRWSMCRIGHPAPAAVANAVVFAWFIAAIFPLVR
jgi:alpha-beta hydrolase superfamily lysophospholipase